MQIKKLLQRHLHFTIFYSIPQNNLVTGFIPLNIAKCLLFESRKPLTAGNVKISRSHFKCMIVFFHNQ